MARSMVFIRLNRLHPYTCANSRSSARSGSFTNSPFISSSMMAFCACRRFSACWKTSDCGESITSAVTSSPRWAGRQCRKIASRWAWRNRVFVDLVGREDRASAFLFRIPDPCWPRRRCRRHRRPETASRGSLVTVQVPPVSRPRSAGPADGFGFRFVPGRSCDPDVGSHLRAREHERVRDVIAVANVGDLQILQGCPWPPTW